MSSQQTLSQLNNGELSGVTRLQLSENLSHFPEAVFDLADSLEILDLSNNLLSELPDDLYRLTHLRILFCSNNCFKVLPAVLGKCKKLEMIGFKNNQIHTVSSESLPTWTRWLILTDNQITLLPDDFGRLARLQKLALAGNRLTSLPESIKQCKRLELIRIAANRLTEFPNQILTLPRLAWLAFSGNPFSVPRYSHDEFQTVEFNHLNLHQVLGEGASGVISKANWNNNLYDFPKNVAIKVFKGDVTSDGYPEDELDTCLAVGDHVNLVKPLAKIKEADCSALVMALIPDNYTNLGHPPSFETCTRDTFTDGQSFSIKRIAELIDQVDQLIQHFERKQVSHGDLYAHNALVNQQGHLLFGDFGAASKYNNLTDKQQESIKKIEQRAVRHFIDDMLSLCNETDKESESYYQLRDRVNT